MKEQKTEFYLRNILVIFAVLVMFFSEANFFSGLKFHTTDISESAGYKRYEQLEKTKMKKAPFSTTELDKSRKKIDEKIATKAQNGVTEETSKSSAKLANSHSTAKSGSPRTLNLTGVRTSYHNCNNDMSTPSSGAYYCNFRGSQSIFMYGHNRAGTFATLKNLRVGDQVSVRIGGRIRTYKVVNTFRLTQASTAGPAKSNLRIALFTSNYGGAFKNTPASKRITFQTCEGANDVYRRYVQAVEL